MEEIVGKKMYLTPTDLRVGNYINYESTTHIVAELHGEKIIHYWINGSDGYVTKYNQILSIPISKRELESLGFNEDPDRIADLHGFYDDRGYLVECGNEEYWFCALRGKAVVRICVIDFIHELQNIYFLMTKKELKYED